MRLLIKYYLVTLTAILSCLTSKAERKIARINDKDGFTNIREGQGTEFKIVGTVNADDFFYCEPTTSDWWKVTALKWTDRGQQIEGFIFKGKVQFLSSLPDNEKQNIILTVFANMEQFANKFHAAWESKDSAAYRSSRTVLEKYSDIKYSPMLYLFADYFCETADTITLKQFFATVWADKGSASEEPSFAIGNCFVCNTDVVLKCLKNVNNKEQLELIARQIEWGLRNHFNVPDDRQPDNPNQKEVDEFDELMKKLKAVQL